MKLHLAVLMLLVTPLYAKVTGLVVQSIVTDEHQSVITFLNQSDKGISGFSLEVNTHFSNGTNGGSGGSSFSTPGNPLIAPHQTYLKQECCYNDEAKPTQVDASAIMVIYTDGTAEAEEGEGVSSLNQQIENQDREIKTAKVLADLIGAAMADSSPIESARTRLKDLIGQEDETLQMMELDQAYKTLAHTAEGNELETLKQQRQTYLGQVAVRSRWPKIRRIQ